MAEHSTLTDPELHEPKGAAAASANNSYVADGAGSGSWKTGYVAGSEDYQDTAAAQSLGVGFANRTYLTNNGLGSLTTSTNRLPGKSAIFNTTTGEFVFDSAGYSVGDQIIIRVDFDVTTSGANHEVVVGADFAIGTVVEFSFSPYRRNFKTATTYNNSIAYLIFDIGNVDTRENPAKIFAYSDAAGDSLNVNGWRVFVKPQTIVWA